MEPLVRQYGKSIIDIPEFECFNMLMFKRLCVQAYMLMCIWAQSTGHIAQHGFSGPLWPYNSVACGTNGAAVLRSADAFEILITYRVQGMFWSYEHKQYQRSCTGPMKYFLHCVQL